MSDELTDKQQAFITHYVACLNATKAAALAKYEGNRATLAVIGSENLRKPYIRAAIDAALAASAMPASEVLARLTAQARGSMADVLRPKGRGYGIDLKAAEEVGALDLVKKYTKTVAGVSVELYDAQAALTLLGKHHKLFTDNVAVSGTLTTKGYTTREGSPDAWDDADNPGA